MSHDRDHHAERRSDAGGFSEVEALVRAAGGYVDASDDLRPRLLESVRAADRHVRRRNQAALAAAAVLTVVAVSAVRATALGRALDAASHRQQIARAMADPEGEAHRAGVDTLCWELVDAFWSVRRDRADAVREASAAQQSEGNAAQAAAPGASEE